MLSEYLRDLYRYRRGEGISDAEEIHGKVVVITGANSGIGKAAALEFARRGAKVVMGCRNVQKGQAALNDIKEKTETETLEVIPLDLSDQTSVREFAARVKMNYPEIHILLNNAGLSDINDSMKTKEGYSLTVATNYLGHFLLTNLLLDNLKKGAPARVITVVSSFLMMQKLDLDDVLMTKPVPWYKKMGNAGYNNSKYALALYMKELGKRLQGSGVTTYSVCPCLVKTDFLDDEPCALRCVFTVNSFFFGLTPDECAEEYITPLALSKKFKNQTGLMWRMRKPLDTANKFFQDKAAEKLWQNTMAILQMDEYTMKCM